MTATEGGPALGGALAATPAGGVGGSRVTMRSRPPRLRTVLGLATVEAWMLLRSLLVLAGLLAGGLVIWILIHLVQPLWWNVAWQIGYGQAVLGMAVLIAAHLAAGRARRDGMADLYASFPATAGTRTLGQLTGLAGALPASLLLIGGTAAVVQMLGPVGVPGIAALAGGLLLVIAAGAAGVAVGTRFPHPLAGVLAGLALFVPVVESNNINGAGGWLLPWHEPGQLSSLPGPLAGYPPAVAHAVELAGIAAAAGIAALAMTVSRARARGGLAAAGILAVAVICLAGSLQLRPIPTADLNHLVAEAASPATAQRCTTVSQIRYCLYPGFGRQLASLEAPVNGVLAHLPARSDHPLTVRQVQSLYLPDSTLTHGHPKRQVSQWEAQLRRAPGSAATASAIYLPVGSWPAAGARLGDARFDVALAAAEWAVRLPPQATGSINGSVFLPCVPLGQAREAIAIWLAILATHPPAGELQDGLGGLEAGIGFNGVEVRNTLVPTWAYPGSNADYVTPAGVPQTTAAGYLLASAMTRAAGTEGQLRPEKRMGYLGELAHHRRPARRRTRHPHAQRPWPCDPPTDPQTRGDNRAGTEQRATEPAVHHLSPTVRHRSSLDHPRRRGPLTQPIRHARRSCLSWLRALPLLARPITQTMPWATLITGCLAGTVVLAITAHVAGTSHRPLDQGTVRLAFLPAIAALAFALRAQFRPLIQATPVPAWVAPAGHILLAAPLLAVTCWAQLRIMARTISPHTLSHPPAIYPLIAQLTGWCAVTVAAAACVDRSRYADLGGAIAVPVSFAATALAWHAPVSARFLVEPPATAHGVTIAWYAIATAALALSCVAMRDQWHRYTRYLQMALMPALASRR